MKANGSAGKYFLASVKDFRNQILEDRLVFGAVGSFIPALDQGIGDQRVMVQPDPDTSEGPFIVAREREFCLVQHFQQAIA